MLDGERSIYHQTNFQSYLEKYFGFRKAYCRLHLKFNPRINLFIQIIYPFRSVFKLLDNIGIFHKLNAIFKMLEIAKR